VSLRSRVAFAAGVAGLAGATLTLSGRFDGSIALVLLFALAARAASAGALVAVAPAAVGPAARSLAKQARFAPAWALVAGVGALRAGSASMSDIRGANAVAGIAIARGPALTVAGVWLALAGGVVALASSSMLEGRRAEGGAAAPVALRRLEAGGALALVALLVSLFAGPQVRNAGDAAWWIAGIGGLSALAWRVRKVALPDLVIVATALAAAGLALAVAGGAP
jgi:hypothetical protein